MARSFRFVPPEPRPDALARPRLLRFLVRRWQHRITAVTGGPGLGKTTLLAQAIAENRLAPRGEDVWVGLEPADADAARLARVVAAALAAPETGTMAGGPVSAGSDLDGAGHPATRSNGDDLGASTVDSSIPEPAAVADAVWHRSPAEACLVFDDLHLLPAGSSGAAWLTDLVKVLPSNGHVLLASRAEPPIPLTRLGTQGAVLWLDEDDLRFSEDELSGFATRRGIDPTRFDATGGWPAMAELAASVEQRFTGEYLWEEVLEPLGTLRRHVLAVLCDLGGADDELASAAVGTPVELSRALDGVPLVARDVDGWYRPHGLWRSAPAIALVPSERAEIRRRAIAHLNKRGRFDEAFGLIEEVGLWDAAPGVLRAACLSSDRLDAGQLGRWLAASTDPVRTSSAGRLATGLHAAYARPRDAHEPLEAAVAQCRAEGDIDAELTAMAQLGVLAWWQADLVAIPPLASRIFELEKTGNPRALAAACCARAVMADVAGDDGAVLNELTRLDTAGLDPAWEIMLGFIAGLVHLGLGQADIALELADQYTDKAEPAVRYVVDALRLRASWALGQTDEVLREMPGVIGAARRSGATYNLYLGLALAAGAYATIGDIGTARRCLDEALAVAPTPPVGALSPHSAVSKAALQLAEGDEAAAAATLRTAMEEYDLDRGEFRHSWRQLLALSYVLLPEAQAYWDSRPLRGYLAECRDLAAAVVAQRQDKTTTVLRSLDLPATGVVRANLPHRFAAELAVGLSTIGRSEGRLLLDAMGPAGRAAVRDLVTAQPSLAKPAKALLAAVPAPPPRTTYLAVLGPLALRRDGPDGEEVLDPDMRRRKLQALLAFLVGHRRTTRSAVAAALWPDLDERAAGNNLGVTLNHLLRLLEPWRDSGEPAYLVRLDGPSVHLVTGEYLRIDVDEFDERVAAATRAEADGVPSVALEHDLAAVDLYRDDLHLDVPEADWFALDREHYRSRFVAAAVRAGQLLLGRGDLNHAQQVAHRALAIDQWSEEAYAVLVGAALARGDRSAARRILARGLSSLADLGVTPSPATQQLQRRVAGLTG